MRRSVDRMQLLSQDVHWIIGISMRCVSVRSTEQVNEIEGDVVQGRTLVFWWKQHFRELGGHVRHDLDGSAMRGSPDNIVHRTASS